MVQEVIKLVFWGCCKSLIITPSQPTRLDFLRTANLLLCDTLLVVADVAAREDLLEPSRGCQHSQEVVAGDEAAPSYHTPAVGLAAVASLEQPVDNSVRYAGSRISTSSISSSPKEEDGERDVGQQTSTEGLDTRSPHVEEMADIDCQFPNSEAKIESEVAEDEDWEAVHAKRRAASNKRPPTSRVTELKTGGLSAAFKRKDSLDEDTFQLDEELESSERSLAKDNHVPSKRFAGNTMEWNLK